MLSDLDTGTRHYGLPSVSWLPAKVTQQHMKLTAAVGARKFFIALVLLHPT